MSGLFSFSAPKGFPEFSCVFYTRVLFSSQHTAGYLRAMPETAMNSKPIITREVTHG